MTKLPKVGASIQVGEMTSAFGNNWRESMIRVAVNALLAAAVLKRTVF